MSFKAITYYVFLSITVADYGALQSRDLCLLSKYASKRITLLRGYIHPNEQPVVFMPQLLCLFAAH